MRDIQLRFAEHCRDANSCVKLHNAIQHYGKENFKIEPLEENVLITDLDEREKYWIKTLNTRFNGYNVSPGGDMIRQDWPRVRIIENGLVFDSKEDLSRLFNQVTSWSVPFIRHKITCVITNREEFLGYHFESTDITVEPSDEQELINWIKTLNVTYKGKHVYCNELDKEFDTITAAAQYLLDNGLYITTSKTPVQSIVTSIGKNIHGRTAFIQGANNQTFTFVQIPDLTTKGTNGGKTPFSKSKIYCPELDMTFNSQTEAAQYMLDNNIWEGIKLKTARLRISDVTRGTFPEYKGYTFQRIET